MARDLRSLSMEILPAPSGLAPAVIDAIGPQDGRAPRRDVVRQMAGRYAAAGVAAAATTATAVAVATGLVRWRFRPLT